MLGRDHAVHLFPGGAFGEETIRDRTTVACVEEVPILYAEVRLPPEQLESGCRLNREFTTMRAGVGWRTRMRDGLERARLKSRILALVREQTACELGVGLGEAELSDEVCDRLSRLLSKAAPAELKQAVGRELASSYRLRRALEAVQGGLGPAEAYHRFRLDDSHPRWAFRIGAAGDKSPPRGRPADLTARLPAARPLRARIVDGELNARIDAQLAARDEDYRRYLEAQQDGDTATLRGFFRRNPLFQQLKRAEWWADRLRHTRIRICVPRFEPVLDELNAL